MSNKENKLPGFTINATNEWTTPEEFAAKNKITGEFQLVEEGKRSSLSEGRSYGFATALAYRRGNKLITTHGLTCCKDFESDVIWSQHNKKPYRIFGLNAKPIEHFFDAGKGYLIFSVELQHGSKYTNYDRDYKTLQENYNNIQKFINWFEVKFKVKHKTKIQCLGKNRFVAIYDEFWGAGTYLISLYILLLRIGLFYKGEDVKTYLKDFTYDHGDKFMLNSIQTKLDRMIEGYIPKQDMANCGSPHSTGIQGYQFPA